MIQSWMFKKGSPSGELYYVMFAKHNPTICLLKFKFPRAALVRRQRCVTPLVNMLVNST